MDVWRLRERRECRRTFVADAMRLNGDTMVILELLSESIIQVSTPIHEWPFTALDHGNNVIARDGCVSLECMGNRENIGAMFAQERLRTFIELRQTRLYLSRE